MRRLSIVLALAGLGLAVAGPSALAAHRSHAGPLPKLATGAPPGYGPAYAVRPHTIWYTGDSTGILGRIANTVPAAGKRPGFLHWKAWTRTGAYAVGTDWYRSGGGAGAFHRIGVTVTLSDPRDGHFVKMTLRDEGSTTPEVWCNPPGIDFWTLPGNFPQDTSCRGARP
jgi:hypothetical protein